MAQDLRLGSNNAAANTLFAPQGAISSKNDINVSLAAASSSAVLAIGYPIGYNKSTAYHAPWMAPDPTVLAIYLGTTPATGGTFEVVVNGHLEDMAFDITAAAATTVLKAAGYDVTVTLASDIYTFTFDGQPEIETLPTVTGDITDLTGDTASSATVTAGTATNGTDEIKGFVNPNDHSIGTKTGTAALVVLTGTDTLCTATTTNAHGLVTGMSITVSGATESNLNITETITVVTSTTFTYPVAAVSGGTVDSGAYTTTNDTMVMIMVEGTLNASLPESLVAASDVTALRVALKKNLVEKGLIVQGLAGRY